MHDFGKYVWETDHYENKNLKNEFGVFNKQNTFPRSISVDSLKFGGKCKKFIKVNLLEFKTEMLKISLKKIKRDLHLKLLLNVGDKTSKFFYSKVKHIKLVNK